MPSQGFKIHITASADNKEGVIFQIVRPILDRFGVSYKVARSSNILKNINRDINQQGKFITVYPRTSNEAARIAHHIDQNLLFAMKKGFLDQDSFSNIFHEKAVGKSGALYSRYGLFITQEGLSEIKIVTKRGKYLGVTKDDKSKYKPNWVTWEPEWDKWQNISLDHDQPFYRFLSPTAYLRAFQEYRIPSNQSAEHTINPEDGVAEFLKGWQNEQAEQIIQTLQLCLEQYQNLADAVHVNKLKTMSIYQVLAKKMFEVGQEKLWDWVQTKGMNDVILNEHHWEEVAISPQQMEQLSILDTVVRVLFYSTQYLYEQINSLNNLKCLVLDDKDTGHKVGIMYFFQDEIIYISYTWGSYALLHEKICGQLHNEYPDLKNIQRASNNSVLNYAEELVPAFSFKMEP